MARKRVNKNLVAFLTVMGILLTIVVVAIATSHGVGKDPEEWARRAREQETAGDFEFAIRLYDRAYQASQGSPGGRDVKYLVDAALCAYRYGEIGSALATLQKAHDEQPGNAAAIVAYLDTAWDLYQPEVYWRLGPAMRTAILEFAESMQEVDAENVLGPVSEAVARLAAEDDLESDELTESKGYAALQHAIELDENDPRVVLTRLRWEFRRMQRRMRAAREAGAPEAELDAIAEEYQDNATSLLAAGVEANPGTWRLVEAQVSELQSQGQHEEARALLERIIEERTDEPHPHVGLAELLLGELRRTCDDLSPEAYAQLVTEAASHARRAIALEPAMYAAYVAVAQAELMRDFNTAGSGRFAPERYEAALKVYDEAISKTVGVRSLEATLGQRYRQLMYMRAFNTALYHHAGATTPEEKEKRAKWVRAMLEPAQLRYPEEAFTYYMQGQMYLSVEGDLLLSIRAFERAEQLANADAYGRYPRLWFDAFGGVLPLERLALLYREYDQPGQSLRYTDEAIARYLDLHRQGLAANPVSLLKLGLNRVELLNLLGRFQEAADYVDEIERLPSLGELLAASEVDRRRVAAAKASALRGLGRAEQAEAVLAEVGEESANTLLMQAQLALMEEDYESAEERLSAALARDDLTVAAAMQGLQMLMPLLAKAEKQDEAKQVLADLRGRLGANEAFSRLLDRYDVITSYRDPQERRAKWLEMVAAEPDPLRRAASLYQYHISQGEYEKAAEYLNELERAQPDDPAVLERQFRLAMRMKQYDRAADYCVALAQQDADHAGGATFRGSLALSQGSAEEAVREYREALAKLPSTCALEVALARALLSANRVGEAVEALEEAVQLNPRDFSANQLLYIAYQTLPAARRPEDDGISYLRAAAELRPSDPFIKQYEDLLNPQAAIVQREQQRRAAPDDVENLIRLGRLYATVGNADQAAERYREALEVDPGNAALARAAADFYVRRGLREAGEEHLRKFIEAQSGRSRADGLILLARYYARLGDVPAAETAYGEARPILEEAVTDAQEQRGAILAVLFDLIELYQRFEGRENELIETCREALLKLDAEEPRDAELIQRARFALIQAKLRLGRLGEADEEITSYAESYPDDAKGLIARAQVKLARRAWNEAYGALSDVLQKLPDHVWSLLTRGNLSVRFGRYVEAKADLMRAKTLVAAQRARRPESADVQLYLSVCSELAGLYEITEQYELAEGELRAMLELTQERPDGGQTVQEIADRLVQLSRRGGRREKAQQVVSEFMARSPDSPYWPFRFGLLCIERGDELKRQAEAAREDGRAADAEKQGRESERQYQTAVTYLQTAQELAARQGSGLALQAFAFQLDALAAGGQAARAVELFERKRASWEQVPAIVSAAAIRAYESLGRRDEALRQLENALRAAGREGASAVTAVLGVARSQLPDAEMTQSLQRLVAAMPDDAVEGLRLRNALAGQLLAAGDTVAAARIIDQVGAQATPGSGEQFVVLMLRSGALEAAGDAEGAIKVLAGGLETYPGNAGLMNNLAYLLADQVGRPAEALEYAERACQTEPRNAAFQDTLGWVYFKNGEYEYAEAALKRALSIGPDGLAANLHLGLLYAERGREGEARVLLLRTQELARSAGDQEYEQKAQDALDKLP